MNNNHVDNDDDGDYDDNCNYKRGKKNFRGTKPLRSNINHTYQVTCILWNVRGPQCEIVPKQLHDQGAILV